MINSAKILYHITGYKDPQQFEWLYKSIYNNIDLFIIHIDKKSPGEVHANYHAITGIKKNVIFLPSISVTWGGCGLIDAELMAIRYALENDLPWTHLVNLSAQDYPLVPTEQLRNDISTSWPSNYVLCNDIRKVHWRIRKRPKFLHMEYKHRRLFTPIPLLKPIDIDIRWSGPWWHILTREFCSWLVTNEKAKRYITFLRNAGMPDELLVQNIIKDSPFRDTMISRCKHEIIWRRPGETRSSSARPSVLTFRDLPLLESSTAFFARKFDHRIDRRILFALAERCHFATPAIKETPSLILEASAGLGIQPTPSDGS